MVAPASPADGTDPGAGSNAPEAAGADAPAVPVVIACSTQDQGAADNAAGGLRERGFHVEVVSKAESLPNRLDAVVDELDGKGLYVLCRGGALDRAGIDGLREMLREREIPFGRTLTLATGQGGARALEERIVSVARRMVTGRFEQVPETPEPAPEPTPEPTSAVVEESDVDRWADSLAHGERPDAEGGADPSGATFPVESDEGDAFYERIDKTLVSLSPDADPVPAESTASFEAHEDAVTTPTAPVPSPEPVPPPTASAEDETEYTSFDGGNMRLYVGGAAAIMITIALIAYFASGTDDAADAAKEAADDSADIVAKADADAADEDGPEDAVAPERPGVAQGESETPKPTPAEPDEAETPEATPAEDAPSDDADAEAAEPAAREKEPPEDPAADVASELAALAAIDDGAAQRALAHRSAVDPALLADTELPPNAPGESAVVANALNEREIRAWNVFLLAGDDAPTMEFSDAETFCKTLTVADVTGWRLPSIGELSSLSAAKVLGKAVFWSETPGDAFGDTRLVLNSRKGSMSSVRADWDGAKPICVRVRS